VFSTKEILQSFPQKEKVSKKKKTYGKNNITTYVHMEEVETYVTSKYKLNEYDDVVDNFKHLRANDTYRKLHIYHARRLGIDQFTKLAKTAEQEGRNPARYFSWLLKNETA